MARLLVTLLGALWLSAAPAALSGPEYVPVRVFSGAHKSFTDFESMLADIARADVVFVGEQHDDANTHRLELQLLEGLARRRGEIVLALEMFERDVQEPLAHFAMGHLGEAEFLQDARPWPQYAADYKPLVDYAIARNWSLVAANVPRRIAADVSASGLDVLKSKTEAEKAYFAKDVRCPTNDAYFKRFSEAMAPSGHSAGAPGAPAEPLDPAAVQRFYFAQCLKDETMGESIAQAYAAGTIGGKRPLVISINGAFHSDFRQGIADRTLRRLPDKRLLVLSIEPVDDLDTLAPGDVRKRADYLVYTVGAKKP
jgi:uncharacterized iron-regulated protein